MKPANPDDAPLVSRGVVACNGSGVGCVIWCNTLSQLENEIRECSQELDDLGLDDAPQGVSIWEGTYVWHPGPWDCPDDGHTEPKGTFRRPSETEWDAIRTGRSPFDGAEGAEVVPVVPIAEVAHTLRNALVPVEYHAQRISAAIDSEPFCDYARRARDIMTIVGNVREWVDALVKRDHAEREAADRGAKQKNRQDDLLEPPSVLVGRRPAPNLTRRTIDALKRSPLDEDFVGEGMHGGLCEDHDGSGACTGCGQWLGDVADRIARRAEAETDARRYRLLRELSVMVPGAASADFISGINLDALVDDLGAKP